MQSKNSLLVLSFWKENKMNENTPAQQYTSTMDSANLIKGVKPAMMDDIEWADCIKRNKEHIEIMLAKDFWTTEDLTPFKEAVK